MFWKVVWIAQLKCRNYCNSRVLPICLVLLDSQTYKHDKKDLFGLESYCVQTLNHSYIEVDELSGYDCLKDLLEAPSSAFESQQLDIYLYQSEFHKNSNIKEIVEYCLNRRVLIRVAFHID